MIQLKIVVKTSSKGVEPAGVRSIENKKLLKIDLFQPIFNLNCSKQKKILNKKLTEGKLNKWH